MNGYLAVVLIALVAGAATPVEMGPHADIPCSDCHITDLEGGPTEAVTSIDNQDVVCLPCHRDMIEPQYTNHPVFITPNGLIPSNFPLDSQGRLTCSTCHDIHDTGPTLLRTGGSWGCLYCHNK